jgi:hypothetical protein
MEHVLYLSLRCYAAAAADRACLNFAAESGTILAEYAYYVRSLNRLSSAFTFLSLTHLSHLFVSILFYIFAIGFIFFYNFIEIFKWARPSLYANFMYSKYKYERESRLGI